MSRLLEGYDVSGDGLYNAWKSLYEEWEITKKAIESESFKSATSFSDSVNLILSSVLTYPTVQRKPKPARKKLELPKHMTCEEEDEEKRNADFAKEARRQKLLKRDNGSKKSDVKKKKARKEEQPTSESTRKSSRKRTAKKFEEMVSDESFSSEEETENSDSSQSETSE